MNSQWPQLSYAEAKDTYATLHLFTQVVGKIKLACLPWINHSWHVTLLVTTTGLTVLDLPSKNKNFRIDFDFLEHSLKITTSLGEKRYINLQGLSVAEFYSQIFDFLKELEIDISINTTPNEIENAIPFPQDHIHSTYEPEHAELLHKALLNTQDVFTQFRSRFLGKCSLVHFFWGSFDLAVTRFSGNTAPKHPGGVPNLPDWVAEEAYSHELCSAGFWPGSEALPFAVYYSYSYPEPEGYKTFPVSPEQAYYDPNFREFFLPYEVVQKASDPSRVLLDFLQSTYEAAAEAGRWNRSALESNPEKFAKAFQI